MANRSASRTLLCAGIAVAAIYGITTGFIAPLISLRLEALHAGEIAIGLIATASAV
ncbi:MAG: hypothetical protein GKR94_23445 [Gammaproteobacteria bacterium]|nr:hypothetical protein [Gammaproteobacteria bacterium]